MATNTPKSYKITNSQLKESSWTALSAKDSSPPQVQLINITEFNTHLDHRHFLSIKDKTTGIVCQCVICGQETNSIERHQQHLKSIHFAFDSEIVSPKTRPVADSNSDLRNKITEIDFDDIMDLTLNQRTQNNHRVYDGNYAQTVFRIVEIEQKQQLGQQERYAIGNLIWKHIFTQYLNTMYYAVKMEPNRLRKGYLLMDPQ